MGRPINKRFFNTGPGNQLTIRAKIGANAEGTGSIVKQVGSSRYIATIGANTGVVTLVDKANGALAAGEATITFTNASSATKRVKKLTAHRVAFFDGTGGQWSFATATGNIWQAADVDPTPVITITSQPANFVGTAPANATFSVTASVVPTGTLTYQWQFNTSGGAFSNISNGSGVTGATTANLTISPGSTALNTNTYRVIVSSAGATPVTSNAATVTIAA